MKIPPEFENWSKRDFVRLILTEREFFRTKIEELERRLLAYENAHTPPSKRKDHYPKSEGSSGKQGAPVGHEGTTRPTASPTETKTLHLDLCPDCHSILGKPVRVERRVVEELPEPQPLRVIEFFIPHYNCKKCKKEIIPAHSELPKSGRLGNNLQSQIVLMKYEDRLPLRKIITPLNREHPLGLTAATILDVLRRAAHRLKPEYKKIKREIRKSTRAHADETGSKVEGKNHWLWLFMSKISVLFVFRKRREAEVIEEILGKNYKGVLTVDGLKAYRKIVKLIQRCWAHLLRDAKFLAQKHEGQARILYASLCELFEQVKQQTISYKNAISKMKMFLQIAQAYQELRKFATTLENGLEHWFTCLIYPDVEPTNNRAEQQLREFVIQRKIYPTYRSETGPQNTVILMSLLATWKLRGLNPLTMLRQNLSS